MQPPRVLGDCQTSPPPSTNAQTRPPPQLSPETSQPSPPPPTTPSKPPKESTRSKQPPPPPPNPYQRVLTSKSQENPSKSPVLPNHTSPRTGRDNNPPALSNSLPPGSLYSDISQYISLLAELKPACHYQPLPSLKTPPILSHKKLHGYLGASPTEETLLRDKLLTTNMDSRSLRERSPARSPWTRPPPPPSPPGPVGQSTSPLPSPPGPAGTDSSREQASDTPPVEQNRGKPENRDNYKPARIITEKVPSAGATGPPPSSTDRERPPSPATRGLGTPGGPAAPSSRRGCSKQLNSNLFENAALQFRKCEKNKDHIKDDAGDILQSEYWRTRAHKKRWEENGMSGGADLRMKQAGAELSETNNKNWVEGGGNSASTKATKTTKMATGARITTTEETKQPGNKTIK